MSAATPHPRACAAVNTDRPSAASANGQPPMAKHTITAATHKPSSSGATSSAIKPVIMPRP